MPVTNNKPLRVCYFGTYRANYSRNQMMIAGLQMNGVEVSECHETLWHGIEDRVRVVSGEWMKPAFWWRVLRTYARLLKKYTQIGDYDVLIVGYPGQFDVFLARVLTWIKHRPLVWDIFMSIYLISLERGLDQKSRMATNLMKMVEGVAVKLPNLLILDTRDYVDWFTKTYGIKPERFRLVPTGADDRIFYPEPGTFTSDTKFLVLYSGTFIPNHGVMYIVDAARQLQGEPEIRFELIGAGPELEKAKEFVAQNHLTNVKFVDWLKKDQLKLRMSQADVCLGAFGITPQSLMTVQNKIYETLAMGRPLISGDSPAVRQAFTHEDHIYLCKRADGQSLAEAIVTLWKDPELRVKISQNGYNLYQEKYQLVKNGQRFFSYLSELKQ
jgi:glycosyltransferase involved in cell wall biosynthesis